MVLGEAYRLERSLGHTDRQLDIILLLCTYCIFVFQLRVSLQEVLQRYPDTLRQIIEKRPRYNFWLNGT